MKQLKHIIMLTQFAFSIIGPLLLCILAGRWLMTRFSLGGWVMAVSILLGLGGAVSGLVQSMKQIQRASGEDARDVPVSFNEHE